MGDLDTYTAFCFDEACAYIAHKMQDKDSKEKLYFDEDLEKLHMQSQDFLGGLYDALKGHEEGVK